MDEPCIKCNITIFERNDENCKGCHYYEALQDFLKADEENAKWDQD